VGRRLGQHFLIRKPILQRIAAAACEKSEPVVIEIGPGKGALTEYLLARADRVLAIETDPSLVRRLNERFSHATNLTLIQGDVLATNLAQWGPAVVAGNLPYYITSPILKKVLALGPLLRRAVLTMQKEVAERLTAEPGTRHYGFLTVQTRLFATTEILFAVPPSAFRPSPKVDSAVVRLQPHQLPDQWAIEDLPSFLKFVGQCFRHKRKTICNNLAGLYDKADLAARPETSLRAEQFSISEFAELYHQVRDF
jgi:16S rRNA (adenine1518-N6/adenine1519-N6)-dimethyltransferase